VRTTTTSTTTTTTPASGCPSIDPRQPASRADASAVRADLDGDGADDDLSVYATTARDADDPVQQRAWRLRAALATGAVVDVAADLFEPVLFGTTDLDGDGRAEAWLDPRDYNTAHNVELVVFDDCRPTLVTGPEGEVRFPYGRGGNCCPGLRPGTECVDVDGDGRNEIVTTAHDDGTDVNPDTGEPVHLPPTWAYTAYRLDGADVTVVREEADLPSDPGIGATFRPGLRCQGVTKTDED
jgi:hypothetical protein